MQVATVFSRGLDGLDAPLVRVEAHLGNGLPGFHIVGLPEAEVREARDRVRAAMNTSRFEFPARRLTVNLAPADLPKESGRFDLPIAVAILVASGQLPGEALGRHEFAGELALTGELRRVRGALAMTYGAQRDGRPIVLPESVAAEGALARGAVVLPARSLLQVCAHLQGLEPIAPCRLQLSAHAVEHPDLADVCGQAQARRALEVAAAGSHSMLLLGPPGVGKTMLAVRLPGILPPMTEAEAIEAASMESIASGGFRAERFGLRPFRSPHHTASAVALVGGGSPPRPGEVSLAHHGVLFLDELPEFSRSVLEVLREPLESGRITISRAARQADFPARFQLVAAMNPCPCGYQGHHSHPCRCSVRQVAAYRQRISGPLLDRIDLHVELGSVPPEALAAAAAGEPSREVRWRVLRARERQLERQGRLNARLEGREVEARSRVTRAGRGVLREAASKLCLSARAYQRVMKVARTIADLEGAHDVEEPHVAEALRYRPPGPPADAT